MKPLLGGKGANLAEMIAHWPAGTSGIHDHHGGLHLFLRQQEDLSQGTSGADRNRASRNIEKIMGYKFGDAKNMPLLVAVRSGARDSMPGMMDTILNLGLNDQTVLALAKRRKTSGSRGIAIAASSRCMATWSWACKSARAKIMNRLKQSSTRSSTRNITKRRRGHEADVADLKELVSVSRQLVKERTGKEFPNDPWEQLEGRGRRGVWFMDERPRDCVSPQIQHSRRMGNRGQCAGDGLRQHRR